MVAPRAVHLAALLLLTQVGCAGLQDAEYCVANWARAESGWLTSTSVSQRWTLSDDYEHGWKAGYKAALTGRACNLPAVPPPCYWSSKYQSCEGRACIAEWYKGWQCGAAAAQGTGTPPFHEIPVGPQAPSAAGSDCKGCVTPDKCRYDMEVVSQPESIIRPGYVPGVIPEAGQVIIPQQELLPNQLEGQPLGLIGPSGNAPSDPFQPSILMPYIAAPDQGAIRTASAEQSWVR